MKIQDRLGTLHPDGNEGTVTVESGQGEGGVGLPAHSDGRSDKHQNK